MSNADLGGPLLRSVSRSFYLTIRLLPAKLRAPVGLAYLLARASDTIADSADLPGPTRAAHLAALLSMIQNGGRAGLSAIQTEVRSEHAGENVLIAELGRCLSWLETLPGFDYREIIQVLGPIIHGQTLDVERFAGEAGTVRALATGAELEEYTYLVAGCVGEFWTRVCGHYLPRYSALPAGELNARGRDFGKALQFVNILRDLPADLRKGRCYLPADEVDPARLLTDPASGRACFDHWLQRANELLESGRIYIRSLRPARARMGCYLPWELARQTLALVARQYPLESPTRVKVTRSAVRGALFRGAIAAFSNAPLQ